jgi:hypothetical protein
LKVLTWLIESLTTAVPQLNPDQKVLNIYPNPVNDETIVSIRLDAPGEIDLVFSIWQDRKNQFYTREELNKKIFLLTQI